MTTRKKKKARDGVRQVKRAAVTKKNEEAKEARASLGYSMTPDEAGLVVNRNQRIPHVRTDQTPVPGAGSLSFTVASDSQVVLDHKKAAAYCDLPIFPGEREVADGQVQFLHDEMRKGTFNPLLVILSSCWYERVLYKINGQHTCWAVLYMPEDYAMTVREIVYRVDHQRDLKMLYGTYDRGKVRSEGHIAKNLLVGTPAMQGLSTQLCQKLATALKFWLFENRLSRKRCTPEQVEALANGARLRVWRQVGEFITEHCNEPWQTRQPVIAAMFATFDAITTRAGEFWLPVMTGLNLSSADDPRHRLRWYLTNAVLQSQPRGTQFSVSSETLYRVCVSAWNHWRAGRRVRSKLRGAETRVNPK